ncbi:MAG: hypothetical protein IJJ91_00465 [Synergistaceae bacterium]|nr:hypothetical protein [Synergistaceae bacterium]MBQ6114475.1 hypothetical protein [Synergistaceae bacterium]MBQ6417126.1 hypothetical protein [Synergistaceae bacterium]MBQ6665098.1 hypothetical protein [Synergistaceae bacterium]
MEAVMEKKKQSYVFDRKLTDEEIHELVENYEYEPDVEDNGVLWDRFGNPTESMIRWTYERNHGLDELSEPMTLEELAADWAQMLEEVDDEESRAAQQVSA